MFQGVVAVYISYVSEISVKTTLVYYTCIEHTVYSVSKGSSSAEQQCFGALPST
jgi:hypothetical protein